MHTVDQVLAAIAREARPMPPESIRLEHAQGLVLAQPVVMDVDSPPFDRSQLDGYAVRAADCTHSAELKILGQIDAGDPPPASTLTQGQCLAINTGAIIPPGADAVLMVEHSQRIEGHPEIIRVQNEVAPGAGIQRRASDAAAGQTVIPAGIRLTPAHLALCAAAGLNHVPVRKLTAALLTTGDELVPPSPQIPPPGKIRNANHPMLSAMLRERHVHLLDLGSAPDQEDDLRERLTHALDNADLLVVSGGMSMGTKDLVPPLLKDLAVKFHVEKVRMKPGKPFIFGTLDRAGRRKYIAALPGNPVSAFVTFHLFVTDLIARIHAQTDPTPARLTATLAAPLPENGDREFFQPCILRCTQSQYLAHPLPWRNSADLITLSQANALLIRPVADPPRPQGAAVQILPLCHFPPS